MDGISEGLSQITRVNQFSRIEIDGRVVHERPAYYVMLNKPAGVVSARKDADHVCVVDIITPRRETLAGGADGEPCASCRGGTSSLSWAASTDRLLG